MSAEDHGAEPEEQLAEQPAEQSEEQAEKVEEQAEEVEEQADQRSEDEPTDEGLAQGGAGEAPAHEMSEDQRVAALREEIKKIRVADIAHDMMLSLVTLGYQKLGLTGETRDLRDLDDARLAIDLLRATIDVLGRESGPAEVEAFRSTLATMQLNYARVAAPPEPRVEAAGPGEAAEDEAAGPGDAAEDDAAGKPQSED